MEPLKITIAEILNSIRDLESLEKKISDVRVKYDIAKLLVKAKKESELYDKLRIELLEKLAIETVVNDTTTKYIVKDGVIQEGQYNVDSQLFFKELQKILEIEVEINWSIKQSRLLELTQDLSDISLTNILCYIKE